MAIEKTMTYRGFNSLVDDKTYNIVVALVILVF